MTTKLDSVLKREVTIGGEPYTLTISPEGFSLTIKGRRNGLDIAWADLVGGDAALATALNASLTANIVPRGKTATNATKTAAAAKVVAKRGDARPTIAETPPESGASTAKSRAKAAVEMLWPRTEPARKPAMPKRKPAAKPEPRGRVAKVVARGKPATKLKRK